MRIEVLDGSAVRPRQRRHDVSAATGRGVTPVASLSTVWGETDPAALRGFAKAVFFVLPASGGADPWAVDRLDGLQLAGVA